MSNRSNPTKSNTKKVMNTNKDFNDFGGESSSSSSLLSFGTLLLEHETCAGCCGVPFWSKGDSSSFANDVDFFIRNKTEEEIRRTIGCSMVGWLRQKKDEYRDCSQLKSE